MKNYTNVAVHEVVYEEIVEKFITGLKIMDSEVAKRRLQAILCYNHTDITFINVAGQFNSLLGHKTSAD